MLTENLGRPVSDTDSNVKVAVRDERGARFSAQLSITVR
jgi:hypothetical protein